MFTTRAHLHSRGCHEEHFPTKSQTHCSPSLINLLLTIITFFFSFLNEISKVNFLIQKYIVLDEPAQPWMPRGARAPGPRADLLAAPLCTRLSSLQKRHLYNTSSSSLQHNIVIFTTLHLDLYNMSPSSLQLVGGAPAQPWMPREARFI